MFVWKFLTSFPGRVGVGGGGPTNNMSTPTQVEVELG